MTIIMVILVMVAIFFCIMPVYKLIKKRMNYWDQVENDPRWNIDHFQFSPTTLSSQAGNDAGNNNWSPEGNTSQSNINNNKSFPTGRGDQLEIKMPPAYA